MLHGIIHVNEEGNVLDERDNISEKNIIFRIFSYKFLASGAKILGIYSLVIIKPMHTLYRCFEYIFHYFVVYTLLKYRKSLDGYQN